MNQIRNEQSLVSIIKPHCTSNKGLHSVSGISLFWDIDLTLADTMSTNTTPAQQALFRELYVRMNNSMAVMTGRSSDSVEKTLTGLYPGSYEHHSAIRATQGGSIIALAPETDTNLVGGTASKLISQEIRRQGIDLRIASTPDEVRSAEGKFALVYPEVKKFAVALVHSLGHGHETRDREVLKAAAQQTIELLNLSATHAIAVGSDAVEIVPKGISPKSLANTILPQERIERLELKGLNKGQGIHDFMRIAGFEGTKPWVIGDSGTDGKAMNKASKYYEGGGIWVLNGKSVPAQFADAVQGRTIENFMRTWDAIEVAVDFLREQQRVFPVRTHG